MELGTTPNSRQIISGKYSLILYKSLLPAGTLIIEYALLSRHAEKPRNGLDKNR